MTTRHPAAARLTAVLLASALGLALAAAQSRPEPSAATGVQRLAWMTGVWRIESGEQRLEETWSAAADDAILGMFRWSRDGRVWMYELMAIETHPADDLVFTLRHFYPGLKLWPSEIQESPPLRYTLAEIGPRTVAFGNDAPGEGHPHRFVFRRIEQDGRDGLRVELVTPGEPVNAFTFPRASTTP